MKLQSPLRLCNLIRKDLRFTKEIDGIFKGIPQIPRHLGPSDDVLMSFVITALHHKIEESIHGIFKILQLEPIGSTYRSQQHTLVVRDSIGQFLHIVLADPLDSLLELAR